MSSSYDVPPLGLDNGQFYVIHVTALLAMCASFTCASIVIGLFIKQRKAKRFYDRSKSERMIVYAAACDATFNVIHSTEHIQTLVTKNLVLPRELCKFHGLMTLALGFAQVFLVLSVAVNIFCMMFLQKNISFGKYDWRLLTAVILGPFLIGFSSLIADKIGPNGALAILIFVRIISIISVLCKSNTTEGIKTYDIITHCETSSCCFFDSVRARQLNLYLATIPLCLVLVNNAILYGLSWYRIRSETKRLAQTLGGASLSTKRTHRAAKNMFLLLISFFVQWWALCVYGVWQAFGEGPTVLYVVSSFFSNTGGVWNGIVYITIRRRRRIVNIQQNNHTNNKVVPRINQK